jgi:hypothetical protein
MLKTNRIYDLPAILMRYRLITLRELLLPDLLKKIISLNEVTNISNDKSVARCTQQLDDKRMRMEIRRWKSLKRMFFLNELRGFTKLSYVLKFSPECCFYSTFLFTERNYHGLFTHIIFDFWQNLDIERHTDSTKSLLFFIRVNFCVLN